MAGQGIGYIFRALAANFMIAVAKGVGAAILEHILGEARRRGIDRIYLETGSGEAFEPALELYRRRGFESCGAFSDYVASEFNQFMRLAL